MSLTRQQILEKIKDTIQGVLLADGRIINADNSLFDADDEIDNLPKFAVIPETETIRIGLFGTKRDRIMRVGLMGYTTGSQGGLGTATQTLFDAAEKVIEAIINKLTDPVVADSFGCTADFSIIEMGPVIIEQYESDHEIAYMSLPLTVAYIEN